MQEPTASVQRTPLLSAGFSTVHVNDGFDEDISIMGNRVVWSAAGIVRRRFTLESPSIRVLQASLPQAILPLCSASDKEAGLSHYIEKWASHRQEYVSGCCKTLSSCAAEGGNGSIESHEARRGTVVI